MSLSTKYNPAEVESKWYRYWMDHQMFRSTPNPNKQPYCVVIPPPNVTGVLHMGHMLNNTIQDVLVRKARMEGRETCWVPGTDHASIATEARVVAMLREKGIKKSDLSRDEFLEYAWEWREKYGGIILEQLKRLGASCDWERTAFTMDPDYYKAVIDVFVNLYESNYLYRGLRMVNWDPVGKTALSDDEVNHRDVPSQLYHIRYPIEGSDEHVVIATVRPETIMADAALCVNPKDERYRHLKGKRAIIPLINRPIPIIEDEYVLMDFGTGCLKVTPAHDMNDYDLGLRHHLELIDILNEDGTLNEKALIGVGLDRFEARKEIVRQLEKEGFLDKTEDYTASVGFSERTDAVIEPRLSMQWFVRMKNISKPAYDHVIDDTVRLIPAKFKNTYRHWMENVRDWCISRQLWWGHRIPAWYDEEGNIIVAHNEEEAIAKYEKAHGRKSILTQDPDVLDTWFSSWLWPIAVFDTSVFRKKEKGNEDLNYYYPTNDLVTAPEILFFWVARMIIAGYLFRGHEPFTNVYLTGVVRDKLGRKMSKSLGNSPDAIELMNLYGADGVRVGMLFSAPAGNDLLFDEKLCEQGRNFANKVWNAFRLVKGWNGSQDTPSQVDEVAINWFEHRLSQGLLSTQDAFAKFRISDALLGIYKLIWDDFCSWYLEMVKPEYGKPINAQTLERTVDFFETLLKMLHPFMPFISEELWHLLRGRGESDCLIQAAWPIARPFDDSAAKQQEQTVVGRPLEPSTRDDLENRILEGIMQIRKHRQEHGLKQSARIEVIVSGNTEERGLVAIWKPVIEKIGQAEISLQEEDTAPGTEHHVHTFGTMNWYFPSGDIDVETQRLSLKKDIDYLKGFLKSVNAKLTNKRFVEQAPSQVVENERKKKDDTEAKLKALEETLDRLN